MRQWKLLCYSSSDTIEMETRIPYLQSFELVDQRQPAQAARRCMTVSLYSAQWTHAKTKTRLVLLGLLRLLLLSRELRSTCQARGSELRQQTGQKNRHAIRWLALASRGLGL